jgi:hypothetical protein
MVEAGKRYYCGKVVDDTKGERAIRLWLEQLAWFPEEERKATIENLKCVATMWVSAPARRMPRDRFREIGKLTMDAGREISRRIVEGA